MSKKAKKAAEKAAAPTSANPTVDAAASSTADTSAYPAASPTAINPMASSPPSSSHQDLGNRAHLDKIDKLRALGLSASVSLPQIVAVGDQSAGKSSVLESLTGFHFPRAVNLCTRHATEIICRREPLRRIVVSIQPDISADHDHAERARTFKREMTHLGGHEFKKVFQDAAEVMGIGGKDGGLAMGAFSKDVLRVEMSGPDEANLTVIDVPGIFEHATPGITVDSDIDLVKNMVRGYIREPRTIILAVVPCNVDIATQTILKYASEVDPDGTRTVGILTKPDLATEQATKASVVDLLLGKRRDLALGYCAVRNRGADDLSSSSDDRDRSERAFFAAYPWTRCPDRVGIPNLKVRLRDLLSDRARIELPKMSREIAARLQEMESTLDEMGPARCTAEEQRAYLAGVAGRFEKLMAFALDGYYSGDGIFDKKPELKLITRMREINENFAKLFYERGHMREFAEQKPRQKEPQGEDGNSGGQENANENRRKPPQEPTRSDLYPINFQIPTTEELDLGRILSEPYFCPYPLDDDIIEHIHNVYQNSRGYELGTYNSSMIPVTFREQTQKWEPLVLAHVSNAILVVHHFIRALVDDACNEAAVREELWSFIQDSLTKSYIHAMEHARFLLQCERDGPRVFTANPDFEKCRSEIRSQRVEAVTSGMDSISLQNLTAILGLDSVGGKKDSAKSPESPNGDAIAAPDLPELDSVRNQIHDNLCAYYDIVRKRFVDNVCVSAVGHFLLGEGGPLGVLSQANVLRMGLADLEIVAGEDTVSRNRRERLQREVEGLREGLAVLKAR